MNLTVGFWIRDPEGGTGNVRSDVNLVILDVLAREGIEIPRPQRIVHAVVTTEKPPPGDEPAPTADAA
jgi:small-conductance mechanosensitive channel